MKTMLKSFYTKPLVIYLVTALIVISTLSGPAEAMFVPSAPHADGLVAPMAPAARAADMARIQAALESKVVQQRLMDYGLTPEEAAARLNKLSDEQLHQLAANLDSVEAGGDAAGLLIGLLIVALLVVVLIYLLEGRIVVKHK